MMITDAFDPIPGYLNTASVGLPPRSTVEALKRSTDDWAAGRYHPPAFDELVDRGRAAFAKIVGVRTDRVATISQVSAASGIIATSLPRGARVLCAIEDFTSVLYPFSLLAAEGKIDLRTVPLHELIDAVGPDVDLVAVSAVQSADGRVLDLDALAEAAHANGVRTYIDLTQAAGWLPVDAGRFDVTACGAYKWLCSPRGAGFMTVREDVDWLLPTGAGWYAGDQPWDSVYGPALQLAPDARKFNLSPVWLAAVGAVPALEHLVELGVPAIHEYSVGLANSFRQAIGLEPSTSAIVSVDLPNDYGGTSTGVVGAVRAGKLRFSFYLYNDEHDVERAIAAVAG